MQHVPFKFGEVVTGKLFTNREEEIEKLQQNFLTAQNTIIISPKRYGKSSLVKEAVSRFQKTEKLKKIVHDIFLLHTRSYQLTFAVGLLRQLKTTPIIFNNLPAISGYCQVKK